MPRPYLLLAVAALGYLPSNAAARVSDEAIYLRNLGIAELENEQPAKAEEAFKQLIILAPEDPLGFADLAVAALRQQKFDEATDWIDRALEKTPGAAELLAIKAEILQWSGEPRQALDMLREAAARAPENVEVQYALYRQASVQPDGDDGGAAQEALARLRELRPENLLVIMQLGQRAIRAGGRADATAAFLRIRELIWQAPPAASTLMEQVLGALEENDLEAARVPAMRLENVLKITPMHREGLRELSPGIQGIPLTRFRDEPKAKALGRPIEVTFEAQRLSSTPVAGRALAVADLDGDQRADIVWVALEEPAVLEIRWADGGKAPLRLPAEGVERLLVADLDNDGWLDLIGYGGQELVVWQGTQGGSFQEATKQFGLRGVNATAATVIDFDIEGDLDLALASGRRTPRLYRNALSGPLEEVGDKSLPELTTEGVTDLLASDLDRDGDLDLLIAHQGGLIWLDNLRQGRFVDRSADGGLTGAQAARAVVSVDLDNDGLLDLVTAGRGLQLLHNIGGRYAAWEIGERFRTSAEFTSVVAFDADNDGRSDLAVAGPGGLVVLALRDGPAFDFLPLSGAPPQAAALAVADLDADGDLDLLVAGPEGLHRLDNQGGNRNGWLSVRLRGLDKGNSKNNLFGLGATLEVRAGRAYQFKEVRSDITHFGLGGLAKADLLRVVWTNGVPQNRLDPKAQQWIVEEQVLKGSCPFLYAWDGTRMRFVTDLLWGSPVGLPIAPGLWARADPQELVRVDGARPVDGAYELRITEELWEAAFFDYVRLWVVDHPADVEVASSLKILPGEEVRDRVLGTRALQPVAAAWDAAGREVSERLRERDEIYADGWRRSPYQGVAAEPWSFTLDLGEAPAAPVRLHLDGWIFPADASLNLAVAQRRDLPILPPRLEVETGEGWQELVPSMGFPAGKTKTLVVDTPPLPPDARRLRIVSSLWLSWDRIAWSVEPADAEPVVRGRLLPAEADLHDRGFSAMYRQAPNAPHVFDYARVRKDSPWLPFPGRYTRYGDVRELLAAADDRSVILGPGDEISLRFDATALPAAPEGWHRTLFLESHGWDKDADRNTFEAQQVEPLPFRTMSGYPYGADESFPDSDLHRSYLADWLTRVVAPPEPVAAD